MTINGRRTFRSKENRRYRVVDLYKQDRVADPDKRYYMLVSEPNSDHYKVCLSYSLDMLKFETIKEAQRYVRDWEFAIQTM